MNNTAQNKDPLVLVVDSDPNELKTLVIGLKLEGFCPVAASTSKEAITLISKQRFCAALIDLMMPEINGLQLVRTVKSTNPEVAAILMSAYHLSPVQLARANTGAVGFVPKPFLFVELVNFIKSKIADNLASPTMENIPSSSIAGIHSPFDVPRSA